MAEELKLLGRRVDRAITADEIETIPILRSKGEALVVELHVTGFTSLCPVTKQPDFAELEIAYAARSCLLETKGLKLWLWSWRQRGEFNENVVRSIAYHVRRIAKPLWVRVSAKFEARGGISVCPSCHLDGGKAAATPRRKK